MILVTLIISIALVGTAISFAVQSKSKVNAAKVRIKTVKDILD